MNKVDAGDYLRNNNYPSSVCVKLINKNIISKYNLVFAGKEIAEEEDALFSLKCFCVSKKICFVNKNFYNYVKRVGSITQSFKESDTFVDRMVNIANIIEHFTSNTKDSNNISKYVPSLFYLSMASGFNNLATINIKRNRQVLERLNENKNLKRYCSFIIRHGVGRNYSMLRNLFACTASFFIYINWFKVAAIIISVEAKRIRNMRNHEIQNSEMIRNE